LNFGLQVTRGSLVEKIEAFTIKENLVVKELPAIPNHARATNFDRAGSGDLVCPLTFLPFKRGSLTRWTMHSNSSVRGQRTHGFSRERLHYLIKDLVDDGDAFRR
jgi:hypothetical protein